MAFLTSDTTIPQLPEAAFIHSSIIEGSVALETAIDNPKVVNFEDLLAAWDELSAVSVEVALAGRPGLLDFANNHCLLFAAIRAPIRVPLPPDVEVETLGLPDENDVFFQDTPIVPADPEAVYQLAKQAHELDQAQNATPTSPSTLEANAEDAAQHPVRRTVWEWKTVGVVYVTMSTLPREVHLGVALLPVYRGYGGGMKACAFAVQWAIETIQAHRVQARIMNSPYTDRAQRLFTALGFAYEGVQRRAVQGAAEAWADITNMGILDTDWVFRRRQRAAPRSMWDELFARHQIEREELLAWDDNREQSRLRRTSSMETVRMVLHTELEWESEPELAFSDESSSDIQSHPPSTAPSPGSSSMSPTSSPAPSNFSDDDGAVPWRSPQSPFGDSEWVLASEHSDIAHSSAREGPPSRPLSAASWSSFESVPSNIASSIGP